MRRVRVDDFMTQHGRHFSFGLQFDQQAPVDDQLAAGQGPCIGRRIVQDAELELQLVLAPCLGCELVPDLVHVRGEGGIQDEFATLGLLQG